MRVLTIGFTRKPARRFFDQPHHCHRRLVAEYLNEHWGGVEIEHLGSEAGS